MSETVRRWHKRAADLRNQAESATDAGAREHLAQLAEAWEAMANARQRIFDLGGGVPEELSTEPVQVSHEVRSVKWGNPATRSSKPGKKTPGSPKHSRH